MTRNDAISKLKSCAEAIKARGATSLFLFGSAVHDSARPDSDLDLFVDYDPERKFSLVDLVDIKILFGG
jgi:predicted nucleotidyltransferase